MRKVELLSFSHLKVRSQKLKPSSRSVFLEFQTRCSAGTRGAPHCRTGKSSDMKRTSGAAEAGTLHALIIYAGTAHTVADLQGKRAFLTYLSVHHPRAPRLRDAPSGFHDKALRRDHQTSASQYHYPATRGLWCKGDRLSKRWGGARWPRSWHVVTISLRPFRSYVDGTGVK